MESYDETDAFKWSKNKLFDEIPLKFRNYHNELLIAHPGKSIATFESVDKVEDAVEKAKFFLHQYREHASHQSGMPVAISCKIANKKYLMSATSDCSINFKESELPNEIPSKTSEFIFYQKVFSTGQESFRFESSLKQDFYLAYSMEKGEKELVLKYCAKHVIDETIKIFVDDI
ncbi:interleukin-18-like [Mixophyes fleayi]|uniref:interleukin-18-like n=1 Tax=Mixophyes fleayi TaxID=3061075 RepID=UPI003F4DEDB0